MADKDAIQAGYTKPVTAYAGHCDLSLLVKPDTDLDSSFIAWCRDDREFIRVRGWLFTFEEGAE